MRDFFGYFFGAGSEIEFENFTVAHFAPILVVAGIILLIWLFREKLANCKKNMYSDISSPLR